MQATPLVSCIMPTSGREDFIPLAIEYFLRQNYTNKELIILDDGAKSIEDMLPESGNIYYHHTEHKFSTVGAKRNHANSLSQGEIIVHLDDDDWYAPQWIARQVDCLRDTGADICGLREVLFYSPSKKISWKYTYPPNEQPWVAGATMAYRKEFWSNHPFKNMQVGEDNHFVWYSGAKVACHDYMGGFISIIHAANTSPKHVNSQRWLRYDIAQLSMILKDDLLKYNTIPA